MTIENDDGNGHLEPAMNIILAKFQVIHKHLGLSRIVGPKPNSLRHNRPTIETSLSLHKRTSFWIDSCGCQKLVGVSLISHPIGATTITVSLKVIP